MAKKRSLFERLTGTINAEDDVFFDDTEEQSVPLTRSKNEEPEDSGEEAEDAQLTVDVYQTPDEIIVKTIVAGVAANELDVSITRDMVTISGTRHDQEEAVEDDYYHRELYWGSFSRTIVLPEEVDVDEARAISKNGLMTLHLPKLDKKKKTKLSVQEQ